jgi:hypothetical protein
VGTFVVIGASPPRYSTALVVSTDIRRHTGHRWRCIIVVCVHGAYSRPLGGTVVVREALVSEGLVHWVRLDLDVRVIEIVFLVP